MKTLPSVIKTLFKVNIVITFVVALLVIAIRQQQAEIKHQISYKLEYFINDPASSARLSNEQQQPIADNPDQISKSASSTRLSNEQQQPIADNPDQISKPASSTRLSNQQQQPTQDNPHRISKPASSSRLSNQQQQPIPNNQNQIQRQPTLAPQQSYQSVFQANATTSPVDSARFSTSQEDAQSSLDKPSSSLTEISAGYQNSVFETANSQRDSFQYANDIAYGLGIARNKGDIKDRSSKYFKIQTAVKNLRQGKSLEESARQANIDDSTLEKLIKLGENRPGSVTALNTPINLPQATGGNSEKDMLIQHANDIAIGLVVAHEKGQIKHGTGMYRRVQTAVRNLRQGKSLEESARQANIDDSVLEQLIKWGERRPGSPANL